MRTDKLLRVFIFGSFMAALVGCATPVYNYVPISTEISEPPLDFVSVAHVGDILVRQGRYIEKDAILLNEAVSVGLLSTYTLARGYYVKQGEDADTEFYLPSNRDGGRIEKSLLADVPKIVQAYKSIQKICVVTVFNVPACKNDAPFSRVKQQTESRDSFQQALIYSGRVGNKIRIGYREFSSDMARPAFNNEAEYDLSDSKIIGYKNAKIEIIEATNESIKYKVLRNFNSANAK
jgi:hypothetical protein